MTLTVPVMPCQGRETRLEQSSSSEPPRSAIPGGMLKGTLLSWSSPGSYGSAIRASEGEELQMNDLKPC